ncbi:MAG: hypothetical protein ACREHF_09510 [Rhizomicrobium sp.]
MALAILLVGCAISLALNWPGQLSYDSVVQLHDGRTGHYNAWHPPVMAWMLGVADSLLRGTGLFILFDTLVFFASIGSLLWVTRRPSRAVAGLAILCAALPQVVLYQGIVWKDVLFADAAVAGFVLLTHSVVAWRSTGWRRTFLTGAFVCFALATLVRQNGFVVLPFGGIAALLAARSCGLSWKRAIAMAAGATAATAGVAVLASAALTTRTVGAPQPAGQIRLLQLYDLAGEVKTDPALKLELLAQTDPRLSSLIRTDGVRLYTPVRNDTLFASARLQQALADASPAAVWSQWKGVLLAHPGDYLQTRTRDFSWVFATPQLGQCMPYYTGVTGPPADLRDLGLRTRFRPQDRALAGYAALFAPTPLFSHVLYAFLALAVLAFLLWRRRPPDIPVACLLGAALAFTLSFFVISIACDYRYLLFLDLSALVGLFYCAASAGGAAEDRSSFTAP